MKRVIRPGWLQYAYLMLVPALFVGIGLATIAYGFSVVPPEWGTRLVAALAVSAPGLLVAAYVFGLSVEIEESQVSKLYLFGLLRETIPLDRLVFAVSIEEDRYGFAIRYFNFAALGGRGAFTLLRTWVWRGSDVDALSFKGTWQKDVNMRRQNWILTVFAVGLPLSGLLIVVVAFGLLLTHALFHWPS